MRRTLLAVLSLAILAMPHIASAQETPALVKSSGPEDPSTGFRMKFGAGWAHRTLFTIPVNAADVSIALGGDLTRHVGLYGNANYFHGSSGYGLTTNGFGMGMSVDFIFDPVRLSAGAGVRRLALAPATGGDDIGATGVGIFGSVSVDLWKPEGHALYLGATYSADVLNGEVVHGPTLALGFRY